MTEYRIDYTLQRRREGEDDFADIGFGSSGAQPDPGQAAHMVESDVANEQWETEGDMPDPKEIKADVEREHFGDE